MESGGAQTIGPATALVAGDGSPIEWKKSCGAQATGWATTLWSRVGDDGAPIEEKRTPKSGGAQSAASSSALPPRRSKVASSASGAPVEDKRRTKSSGAQAVASLTDLPPTAGQTREKRTPAPPSRQSRVALGPHGALMEEKRRTKIVAASSVPPCRCRAALRADGARNKEKGSGGSLLRHRHPPPLQRSYGTLTREKGRTNSGATEPPPRCPSRAALCADGALNEEEGSGSAPPRRQTKAWRVVKDNRMTKSSGAQSVTSSMAMPPRRPTVALLPNGLAVDGVARADVIEYYTHRDGAIYRSTGALAKIYRLHDTSETGLEAMMRSEPTENCSPNWRSCGRHYPHTMMQIFSLKLSYPPPARDKVQVYGFMAVRDSLDPLRNYVFKRTRDDPLIVDREDGLIQMSGPKRGIWWHDMALVEFDMRIKRGEKEADDLQLIDGAVWFHDRASTHARVATKRIDGDYGSVDICYALLHSAMEATVQITAAELLSGFSLCAKAFYLSALVNQEVELFDGVIPGPPDGCHQIYKPDKWVLGRGGQFTSDPGKYFVSSGGCQRYEPEKCAEVAAGDSGERYEVGKYVIAFPRGTKLGLKLKICQSGGSSDCDTVVRFCISPASTHGSDTFAFDLGFVTIHVKISWSTLQLIRSPIPVDTSDRG